MKIFEVTAFYSKTLYVEAENENDAFNAFDEEIQLGTDLELDEHEITECSKETSERVRKRGTDLIKA